MDNKYSFHVGDEVITHDGRVGKITSICTCERCEERGFYEPAVDFGEGFSFYNYITHWDNEDGYSKYYKIGDYTFGNLDIDSVESIIEHLEERLEEERYKRRVILSLMEGTYDTQRN